MKNKKRKVKLLKKLILFIIVLFAGAIGIFVFDKIISVLPVYVIDNRINQLKRYKGETEDVKAFGWIKVPGTNIDYPVIDNNNDVGVNEINDDFAWAQGNLEGLPNKLFILGHNVRNVSSSPLIGVKEHVRFEQLPAYLYYDFAKENKYVQYTTGDKNYLYKIFSVSIVEDSTLDYVTQNYTKEKMKKYVEQSKTDSYFEFDVEVDENDKIISLITCTRFFGPQANYTFRVDARLMRDNEFADDYEVSKKSNYKQIEKKLRGDVDEQEI